MLRFTLLANVGISHFNLLSIQNSCFDMPENNCLGICSSQMTSNKNSSINMLISHWCICDPGFDLQFCVSKKPKIWDNDKMRNPKVLL